MKMKEFPDCCAGLVISDFGGTRRTYGQVSKYTKEEIIDFLNKVDSQLRHSRGFAMLALNDDQVPYMKPYLDKYEYRLVEEGIISPGHIIENSMISIYMKSTRKK